MKLAQPLRGEELMSAASAAAPWLWEGLLANGDVTLLTGMWKAGKTTLLSMLLSRRRAGEVLLDRLVREGGTAVVSEESADLWRRRARQFDFGPNLSLYCRPFAGMADAGQWQDLLEQLAREQTEHGIDLVVFDPLLAFLPCAETDSTGLRRWLASLRVLTERGVAVLLLHHPAKDEGGLGKAARGSGVLPMFADIVLELRMPSGPGGRRRELFGFSRYAETPRRLVIELARAGDDYQVLDQDVGADMVAGWDMIALMLLTAKQPLTRSEILARWPASQAVPHEATLWRWLARAQEIGLIVCEGDGIKHGAFRYRLRTAPEAEDAAKSA